MLRTCVIKCVETHVCSNFLRTRILHGSRLYRRIASSRARHLEPKRLRLSLFIFLAFSENKVLRDRGGSRYCNCTARAWPDIVSVVSEHFRRDGNHRTHRSPASPPYLVIPSSTAHSGFRQVCLSTA